MNLTTQLQSFGLNKKQASVYLACLESGRTSVQNISKKTGIKRTSVYDLVTGLIEQGLIIQTIKGKKRFFVAEDPKIIKKRLMQKQNEFDELLPELQSLYSIPGHKPKIEYYEGIDGIKQVLEKTLTSKEKELKSILPLKDFLDLVGEEFFHHYTQKRIKHGYTLRTIRPITKEIARAVKKYHWGTNKNQKREVRLAPKYFQFSMAMYLFDNKVILMSSKKEIFAFIIESDEFAYNQKALFEVLWQASK